MVRYHLAWTGAFALSLCGVAVHAHHSMAMFDQQKRVSVTGTVREFQWTNPHCYIQMIARDASGKDVEWSMEMGAPMYLYANGWRPSTLKAGDRITVLVNPLRNGQPGGVVVTATTADGTPIGRKKAS